MKPDNVIGITLISIAIMAVLFILVAGIHDKIVSDECKSVKDGCEKYQCILEKTWANSQFDEIDYLNCRIHQLEGEYENRSVD